ncbi:MAG: integrase [Gammaproteobacteria bacterium]
MLALGGYPTVSAKDVRKTAKEAKLLINEGVDPSIVKKQQKASIGQSAFSVIAKEWHEKKAGRWSKFHSERVWQTLKADALPHLGNMLITDIKARDALYVVKQIEDRGALDIAGRVKQRISSVFRYAMQTGYAEHNPIELIAQSVKVRKAQSTL